MFCPTYCQKARIPASSESRDTETLPPLADTTFPLGGYKLIIRATASPGLDRSYAATTRVRSVSAMAARSALDIGASLARAQAVKASAPSAAKQARRGRVEAIIVAE